MLTDVQVERFRSDGFIAINMLTEPSEVTELRGLYDDVFAQTGGFAAGDRIDLLADAQRSLLPQIVNPERYAPRMVQGLAFRNATTIARQLLGADCEPMGNHAILKPAEIGAATPWHQDEAYWDPRYDHHALTIWMPLQVANLGNGCMQFISASHRGPLLPHELVSNNSHGLQVTDPSMLGPATACEIPAGGATIHHGRTLHYAGPNTSSAPRRALAFGFRTPPKRLDTPNHYSWQRPEWFDAPSAYGLE